MKRILVLAAATLAGCLALAQAAAAKEPVEAKVCGASGCETVTDKETLALLIEGGPPTTKAPAPSGFYRVTLTFAAEGERHSWDAYYIPDAAMLRGDNEGRAAWLPLPDAQRAAFARVTQGLEPFPAPRLTSVLVDGTAVAADPSSYLRLFELPAGEPGTPPSDWVPIDLRSTPASPWTAAERDLFYSPSAKALERGGEVVALTEGIAADVEAARALGDGRSGFPWLIVVLVALGAAVLGAGAFALRRRESLVLTRRPEVA